MVIVLNMSTLNSSCFTVFGGGTDCTNPHNQCKVHLLYLESALPCFSQPHKVCC